jgi:hypothetical protein
MGAYSREDYQNRYPEFSPKQAQLIIPHVMYESFSREITPQEGRAYFNIPPEAAVILVFGAIRSKEELDFILTTFKKVSLKNKYLLISNLPCPAAPSKKKMRQYLKWLYQEISIKKNNRIIFFKEFIPKEKTQYFFQSADIVLIPRLNSLNSGNIPLGFAFNRVVVGPNFGNIGQILTETKNPVFAAGNANDAARAIQEGIQLSSLGLGEKNFHYGKVHWLPEVIAKLHAEAYDGILK